jgi:hypothetical protein
MAIFPVTHAYFDPASLMLFILKEKHKRLSDLVVMSRNPVGEMSQSRSILSSFILSEGKLWERHRNASSTHDQVAKTHQTLEEMAAACQGAA